MADPATDSSGFGGLSPGAWGTLGTGALGVGALGYLASKGPTQVMSIPGFAQANAQVPVWQAQAGQTYGEGQQLIGQAGTAYDMAQKGILTPEQKAQNDLMTANEANQAKQTFAAQGRTWDKDTSAVALQQQIDMNATARAQAFIQSTIALATSQMQAGNQLLGTSFNESNAATNVLLEEGKQQVALNKQFSDSMSSAFGAIAKVFGTVAGAAIGGPAGAAVGGALASEASSAIDTSVSGMQDVTMNPQPGYVPVMPS